MNETKEFLFHFFLKLERRKYLAAFGKTIEVLNFLILLYSQL